MKHIYLSLIALGLGGCANHAPKPLVSAVQPSASAQTQPAKTSPTETNTSSLTPQNDYIPAPAQVESDGDITRRLKICLYEAKQLNRVSNNAYRAQTSELYRNIKAAQYYAGVESGISSSTAQMVTPLYQFKINDNCNSISQSLLNELKKSVGVTNRG